MTVIIYLMASVLSYSPPSFCSRFYDENNSEVHVSYSTSDNIAYMYWPSTGRTKVQKVSKASIYKIEAKNLILKRRNNPVR